MVVVDLPFGSYELGPTQALATAQRFVKEAGADAVKLEGGKRDEFHPNTDMNGVTHLYPFPIEDAARTEDQHAHREINKGDARNALLDQIQYNDMKRQINKEQELSFGNQMNRNAHNSLMGENMFHSLKRKKAMELMRSHWEANLKNKDHLKKTSAIFE